MQFNRGRIRSHHDATGLTCASSGAIHKLNLGICDSLGLRVLIIKVADGRGQIKS